MIPNFRVESSYFNLPYVIDAVQNGWGLNRNNYIDKCERYLEKYTQRRNVIMFNNATNASTAGLSYLSKKTSDFITQNNTWIGTISPAIRCGLNVHLLNTKSPYFISENDFDDYLLDYLINIDRPSIICNTDIMGFCADHQKLSNRCSELGHYYIVDSAESLGTQLRGQQSASFGYFSTLSFNSTKLISGTGGGALLTDDDDLAFYAKSYRNNFQDFKLSGRHFWSTELGTNANPSNILSALILGQLESIDKLLAERTTLHKKYKNELGSYIEVGEVNTVPNYWHTCFLLDESRYVKDDLILFAQKRGLELRPGFYSLSSQPFYQNINNIKEINNKNSLNHDYVCLPGGSITDDEISKCIKIMKEII